MATTAQLNDQRQQTLAHLVANGTELTVAAAQLGLTVPSAKVISRSPLFRALVKKYEREKSLPTQERLVVALEDVIENEVIPKLRELIQSEKDTTALTAARATAELYKSLKQQDGKGLEATVNIVLSERETTTLHALVKMDDVVVPEYEEVQSADALYAHLKSLQDE